MLERFSVRARDAVIRARREAQELRHDHIGGEHLLLTLLAQRAGIAYTVLDEAGLTYETTRASLIRLAGSSGRSLTEEDAVALQTIGIDLEAVLTKLEESFGAEAMAEPEPPTRRGLLRRRPSPGLRFSAPARKVLALALREAISLNNRHIGTEHILLGILRDEGGPAAALITDAGVRLDDLRAAVLRHVDKAA